MLVFAKTSPARPPDWVLRSPTSRRGHAGRPATDRRRRHAAARTAPKTARCRQNATGNRTTVKHLTAGCVEAVPALKVTPTLVTMQCGLIPGASGGGLFVVNDGQLVLVGILSTVTNDLTANGIVPLASLHELLEHPDRYTHRFATAQMRRDHSRSPDVIDHEELSNNPSERPKRRSHPAGEPCP